MVTKAGKPNAYEIKGLHPYDVLFGDKGRVLSVKPKDDPHIFRFGRYKTTIPDGYIFHIGAALLIAIYAYDEQDAVKRAKAERLQYIKLNKKKVKDNV